MIEQKYHLIKKELIQFQSILRSFPKEKTGPNYFNNLACYAENLRSEIKERMPDFVRTVSDFGKHGCDRNLLIVHGLPQQGNQEAISTILAVLLGKIKKIEGEGDFLMKIMEQQTTDVSRPAHSNTLEFPMHTDMSYIKNPPDYFVAHCTKRDKNIGGNSLFCDVKCILDYLDEKDVELLKKKNFIFSAPPHYEGDKFLKDSILNLSITKQPQIRFREDGLQSSNEAEKKSLSSLKKAINICKRKTIIQSGSAYLINNKTTLHGRSAYLSGSKRVLHRIYVESRV